jgi:hypothetical protein
LQVNFVGNKLVEHPQTQAYKSILQDSIIIRNISKTIQDGNTSNIPEEAKVKVCSVLSSGSISLICLVHDPVVEHLPLTNEESKGFILIFELPLFYFPF